MDEAEQAEQGLLLWCGPSWQLARSSRDIFLGPSSPIVKNLNVPTLRDPGKALLHFNPQSPQLCASPFSFSLRPALFSFFFVYLGAFYF